LSNTTYSRLPNSKYHISSLIFVFPVFSPTITSTEHCNLTSAVHQWLVRYNGGDEIRCHKSQPILTGGTFPSQISCEDNMRHSTAADNTE
jgi:hypothetical protein